MRKRLRTVVALAGAVGGTIAAIPTPAGAECLYADAWVTREQQGPVYVHQGCIYPTPWNQVVFLPGHLSLTNLPPGTPNGYFLDIRIPVP